MKKITLIASSALLLATIAFTSCKKDYTCVCTYKDSNGQSQSDEYPINNSRKPDAKIVCEAQNIVSGSTDWKCKLK